MRVFSSMRRLYPQTIARDRTSSTRLKSGAHHIEVVPFKIAATNAEFARFVDDGGYKRHEL
jgi:formylglycine-generating enzyme required for sulfatase activity